MIIKINEAKKFLKNNDCSKSNKKIINVLPDKVMKSKKFRNLAKDFFLGCLQSEIECMVLENELLFEQNSLEEVRDLAIQRIKFDQKEKKELFISTNHNPTLLKEAKKRARNNETELASFFYSTYFEHKINWIISEIFFKRKITESCYKQIIKRTNMTDKCSWIMEILGIEEISSKHIKIINNVAEIRNAYVHYKWNSNDSFSKDIKKATEAENLKIKNKKLITQEVSKTVRYLDKFEDKILFNGNRVKIKSIIKNQKEIFVQWVHSGNICS